MTLKIVLLSILFFANLLGLFALISNLLNVPFKAFFGYRNRRTGNKKLYWIGHIILILLLFYFWEEFAAVPPSFIMVSVLVFSSLLSIYITKRDSFILFSGKFYISKTVKLAFIWNLIILYIIGLFFNQIEFVWW